MGVVPEVKIEVQRLGRKEDMVFVAFLGLGRMRWVVCGGILCPVLGVLEGCRGYA